MLRKLLYASACLGAAGGCLLLLGADTKPISPTADAPPLTVSVDVSPGRPVITLDGTCWFPATLRVINTSQVSQSFPIMSCSWLNSWRFSGDPVSGPSFACAGNAPLTITLAPGAEYVKATELRLSNAFAAGKWPPLKPGTYTFKAAFTPLGGSYLPGKIPPGTPTYWSKPVTVQVAV